MSADVAPLDYAGTVWNTANANGWDAQDLGDAHVFYGHNVTVTVHYEDERVTRASWELHDQGAHVVSVEELLDFLVAAGGAR